MRWDTFETTIQSFKWSSRIDSCVIYHNLLKCLSQSPRQWKINVWKWVRFPRWREHHSLLQANTNCQRFDWQVFLLDLRRTIQAKALFPFQTPNTTVLVQYMNTLFKKQIKCHSCEGTCCLRSLGTVDSEAVLSKIDVPSIKERYKSPHNWPSTSGHLLALSVFQFWKHLGVRKTFPLPLSIYSLPALTSQSGWSRWDLLHALKQTVGSFRQKIEGWGKDKKWKGSWVYSHTL